MDGQTKNQMSVFVLNSYYGQYLFQSVGVTNETSICVVCSIFILNFFVLNG